jgi:post-segregation antitoxin (ccd killing protein)
VQVATRKTSVSVDEDLVDAVHDRVGARGVSRFVSRAIRHELEREESDDLLVELEELLGPPDDQFMAEAAAAFDQVGRANTSRSRTRV